MRNSEYDQENPQSRTVGKSPWHHEEQPHNIHKTPGRQKKNKTKKKTPKKPPKNTKAISSPFPVKMIGNYKGH